MSKFYDVVIVGSGPAGLFTALELSKETDLSILLLDKGKDLGQRRCPIVDERTECLSCSPCNMVTGWGGAGAFSDGKLTLTPTVGGRLPTYLGLKKTRELIQYVEAHYIDFGNPGQLYGVGDSVDEFARKADNAGLRLIPVPIRHLGTERCYELLSKTHRFLDERVEMLTGVNVTNIRVDNGNVRGIETDDGSLIDTKYLVLAPGREGADWLAKELSQLGITLHNNPTDIGVRVEIPHSILASLTNTLYEAKLEFFSKPYGDRIRTFCMCPYGEVTMESTGGRSPVSTVNGHSYAAHKTDNTNFAVLCSTNFAEPFRDPIAFGRSVARLANLVSGGAIVQRLGDFKRGRASTDRTIGHGVVKPTLESATPGDVSSVLPYRLLKGIIDMLNAMDKLAPGVASPHTLLYGVEVKFYSSRPELTDNLETGVHNLFAIGDGAGVTRGLVQASASGVVAAHEILRRVGKTTPGY